ncbi:MAG: TolC family protein [Fermentimonas sp.]|nr:TolC family protein [Fermentimonas sp.]MDD2930610.1 TolC family protein [Fermentimonas sp.]MDD3188282.1 TolC family protein [Fermentimonas sp.]MDD4283384.1 TolC family protein [Fermentimonas sp.]MDD4724081.1 TolC family protein [Fermentimonas sp.]
MNSFFVSAQIITIDEVQEKAEANYPAIARYDIIEKTKEFNIANANKAYLPQGTLSAQGTWQSDVTSIDLNMPNVEIPTIDQDQYRIVAELNQTIWDGGRISAQKKSTEANAELEKSQLDSEIYTLRERVNNLYFGILLMKEQINQLGILENELQLNHDNVEVYVQNGLANETDLNTVKVEQLKAGQRRINLETNLEAYIQMLSVLTGEELNSDNVFIKPETESSLILPVINRPELKVFEAQENAIESQKSLLNTRMMPTIGAFAQGGYGKPGLNMFDNEFKPYFSGGVRVSWNFGNLYTLKNDRKKIDLQKSAVNSQRETFLHNLNIVIPQQQIEIEKFKKTMQDDDEIIRLQTQIRQTAEVKVENGTMTVSDLMKEINAEESAKQAKLLHEIQFLMSVYSLKYTTNQN